MNYISQMIHIGSDAKISIQRSENTHQVWVRLGTTHITFMLDSAEVAERLKEALEACKPLPTEAAHAS